VARAASANRTTPYMPSWSVSATPLTPSRAACSISSSGCEAPSRKLKLEWQCSSNHGSAVVSLVTYAWYGWRLRDHAGLSPPSIPAGRPPSVGSRGCQESRRSSSRHGIAGLFHPMPPVPFPYAYCPTSAPAVRDAAHPTSCFRSLPLFGLLLFGTDRCFSAGRCLCCLLFRRWPLFGLA
jgi:hypothetical protein